ncbi:MAG: hypothetical protein GY927_17115 [bacterium]|nr:hypothetical protein [bacterium]
MRQSQYHCYLPKPQTSGIVMLALWIATVCAAGMASSSFRGSMLLIVAKAKLAA